MKLFTIVSPFWSVLNFKMDSKSNISYQGTIIPKNLKKLVPILK